MTSDKLKTETEERGSVKREAETRVFKYKLMDAKVNPPDKKRARS